MKLKDEIIRNYEMIIEGMKPLDAAGFKELCYTYNSKNEVGVAIPNPFEKIIDQSFNHVNLKNRVIKNASLESVNYLFLTTTLTSHINEFSLIASEFVNSSDNYEQRLLIQKDPYSWWTRWQDLIGNSKTDVNPQSLIAELVAFKKIYESDISAKLLSFEQGTFDIQCETCNYEVKSTVSKFDNIVSINSQFQMDSGIPLNLIFVKMESMNNGISINEIINEIESIGYDVTKIEKFLHEHQFYKGSPKRELKYKIHEIRKYPVDDKFPKIVLSDEQKENILKITYSLNLNGLLFESIVKE